MLVNRLTRTLLVVSLSLLGVVGVALGSEESGFFPKRTLGASVLILRLVPSDVAATQREDPASVLTAGYSISGTGTGFFVSVENWVYFVTARHVLFDTVRAENGGISFELMANAAGLVVYSFDAERPAKGELRLDLGELHRTGSLIAHPSSDIAIALVGKKLGEGDTFKIAWRKPGVEWITPVSSTIFPEEQLRSLSGVFPGNEIYMIGYPTSIGAASNHQLDRTQPLLRRGIVGGVNFDNETIVIDLPSFHGNSGGPVLQITGNRISPIGVVTQRVTFEERVTVARKRSCWWGDDEVKESGSGDLTRDNTGYSIAVPIDRVLELLKKHIEGLR